MNNKIVRKTLDSFWSLLFFTNLLKVSSVFHSPKSRRALPFSGSVAAAGIMTDTPPATLSFSLSHLPSPSPSSPPTDTDNTCYANLICCTDRVRATLRLTVSNPAAPEEHKERTREPGPRRVACALCNWLCKHCKESTRTQDTGHRAQGTTFQVRYKRNTREKEKEKKKKAEKRLGKRLARPTKGSGSVSQRAVSQSGWSDVQGGLGATVASHDATLRRRLLCSGGIQLVVVIA